MHCFPSIFNRKSSFIFFLVDQASGTKNPPFSTVNTALLQRYLCIRIYSALGKTPPSAGTDVQRLCINCVFPAPRQPLCLRLSVKCCLSLNLKTTQQLPDCVQLKTKFSMVSVITSENRCDKGRRWLSLRRLMTRKRRGKLLNTVTNNSKLK